MAMRIRRVVSVVPDSSFTQMSWWASAQSTPTKIATVPPSSIAGHEPEETSNPLMEVLVARHPTSRLGFLADHQRHDLLLGLIVQPPRVLIS